MHLVQELVHLILKCTEVDNYGRNKITNFFKENKPGFIISIILLMIILQ